MYKFTALLIIVLLIGFSVTQAQDVFAPQTKTVVTGEEVRDFSQNPLIQSNSNIPFDYFNSGGLLWAMHPITDRQTGYDLQSNASTQQVWLDLNNPGYIHAVFTNSQVSDGTWADRTCLYFGSLDNGETWFELGGVPVNNGTNGRSGFPTINGTSTGSAVIANHNNSDGTTTHSKVFIDNSPFEYNFTTFDPGVPAAGDVIWPRIAMLPNDDGVIASSVNGGTDFYVNTWTGGVFAGWQLHNGDQAETHQFAVSPSGNKVGLAYLGQASTLSDYFVFFKESADGGLTWSDPDTLWEAFTDPVSGNIFGCIRGVSVNFYGEEPTVVFEIGQNTATGYFPGLPAEIHFWSPNVNGGTSVVIADSNNVPYYANYGVADVQYPIGRPVIGRSESPSNYLFVAFNATTGDYWPGIGSTDSTAYFCGMFMYSADGGETWTDPERFTPDTPLLDYRYPSIAHVSPVDPMDEDVVNVHIVMQVDSIPGSTVNAAPPMPVGVTARYYHFATDIVIVSNDDEIIVNNFNLEQNYPNPFNPSTTINYSLAERSAVTLKVYDVLGNEVTTLVNTTQEAGKHNVTFDAAKLASGLYIYTLNTGNFTSSKKMMLLK
ncbi:MAG: T9SS type A sorting domain-containing protein [Ignavibacteriaceae bacterium]